MRVDILGTLGVGKTTLCNLLEDNPDVNMYYEDLKKNPYLADSYTNPEMYAFPSQMNFVMQKYENLLDTENNSGKINIFDQAFAANRAYNRLLADRVVYWGHTIANDALSYTEYTFGPPDVLVYLKCSPEENLKRVQKRGREFENIDLDFVKNLGYLIETELKDFKRRHPARKVIEIDVTSMQLSEYPELAERLLAEFREINLGCIGFDSVEIPTEDGGSIPPHSTPLWPVDVLALEVADIFSDVKVADELPSSDKPVETHTFVLKGSSESIIGFAKEVRKIVGRTVLSYLIAPSLTWEEAEEFGFRVGITTYKGSLNPPSEEFYEYLEKKGE